MSTGGQQRSTQRWLFAFLAAFVAVGTVVGLTGSVSAASDPAAETRVGAHASSAEVLVGAFDHITAGQQLGNDGSRPGIVVATGVAAKSGDETLAITERYVRPSGATTRAQRESVQGKPCVDCGNIGSRQVADHIDPLVREYYRTGTIDLVRMRSPYAVQPQCPVCSARQGADLSRFSITMRNFWGLE